MTNFYQLINKRLPFHSNPLFSFFLFFSFSFLAKPPGPDLSGEWAVKTTPLRAVDGPLMLQGEPAVAPVDVSQAQHTRSSSGPRTPNGPAIPVSSFGGERNVVVNHHHQDSDDTAAAAAVAARHRTQLVYRSPISSSLTFHAAAFSRAPCFLLPRTGCCPASLPQPWAPLYLASRSVDTEMASSMSTVFSNL